MKETGTSWKKGMEVECGKEVISSDDTFCNMIAADMKPIKAMSVEEKRRRRAS